MSLFPLSILSFAYNYFFGLALYGVAFVDSWHFWGFLVIVYLAAMSQVEVDLFEVAILEGANRFQRFWHVTVPGIRPTLVFTLLMIMIWSVPAFDYIYLLTEGGPAHSSEVLATHLYSMAFFRFEVGYAAAIGVTMALMTAGIVAIFVILRRRGWEI
ncbi:sugar ABC transporter permease [Chloroflexi bacterium TSY]|nr:sugar ABC transporter permease [Chloroflexi bacterium TSY]